MTAARVRTIVAAGLAIEAVSGPPVPGASSGTIASSGITAMSCSSSMASAARPCSVASSSRSVRSCSTKAVEDKARPKPSTSAAGQGRPTARPTAAIAAPVTTICRVPRPNR